MIVYLRPDHESVHRTFDVVGRYLLTLGGVGVRRPGVGVDHLRAERRDARSDLLRIAGVFHRLTLLLLVMQTLNGCDTGRTVTVVVVDHQLIGCHPGVTGVTGASTHFNLLFVVVVQLYLRPTNANNTII